MILAVLFVVFWVFRLICGPWPGSPMATWPWSVYVIDLVLFAIAGLALFGYRL